MTTKPFNFAGAANLPPHAAALMQAAANRRAAHGFISADGQTHLSDECRDLYDAGHSLLGSVYQEACDRARKA